jgi:hypothetical protein
MAERKFHYIYKITREDGKFYIGRHSTDDLDDTYFGSGQRLWKSIKKHGKEKHSKEILEFLPNLKSLKLREAELVDQDALANPLCMNLTRGGDGGTTFIGQERIWITNGITQRHHPKDAAIPEGFTRGMSIQMGERVAASRAGSTRSQAAKDKTAAKHRGMKRTSDAKTRMSEAAKARTDRPFGSSHPLFGRPLTLEHRSRISLSGVGKRTKKVSVDGVVYESLGSASKGCGLAVSTLSIRARSPKHPSVFYI